jgi:hypothetical protein
MNLRPRFTLRSLLIIIAIIGLVIGGSIEWRNRQLRDRHAVAEAYRTAWAEDREKEWAICQSHIAAGDPYDMSRAGNNLNPHFTLQGRLASFTSWSEEADWHAEYAAAYRKEASRHADLKRYYQHRLLLP